MSDNCFDRTEIFVSDDETGPPATVVPDDLGSQFTEMFIKNPENMVLLLDLLGVSLIYIKLIK